MVYRAQNLNIKLFTSDKEALGIFMMCAPAFEIPLIVPLTFTIILCLKIQGVLSSAQKEVISQRSREVNKEILITTL